jgi:pyruvate/2-oxoglutarate dehydrogenase complex dihydrolipoamide acyltransferase (E2) component
MNTNDLSYHVVDLPPGRRVMINMLDLPGPTHFMYGLLEVDVTVARQLIDEHKAATGEVLLFTGYLVYCLSRAVEENKEVQAYLKGRKQLVLFDGVDVGMMVEHEDGEKKALMGHVIQGANRKTYWEIHEEIRRVQSEPAPKGRGMPNWFRSILLLPRPLYKLITTLMAIIFRRDPTISVAASGTVFISAVGIFGKGHSGWGITTTLNTLSLVVGSMSWKPAVIEGRIEPREILNLTVVLDHDVIDGAPATRFVRRLVELIESGNGLNEVDNR